MSNFGPTNKTRRNILAAALAAGVTTPGAARVNSSNSAATIIAGHLLLQPKQLFEDVNWNPAFGGKIFTYAAGTLTPKATYQDVALTIANTNPTLANTRGEVLMYGDGAYRVILKDVAGNIIYDIDAVESSRSMVDSLSSALAGFSGSSMIGWMRSGFGSVFRQVFEKLSETVSFADFGAIAGATTDQSVQMQRAFDYIKLRGGTLRAECGIYLGRIDFSGNKKTVLFKGNGTEFRPFSIAQNEVFYCNNSTGTGTYADSNVIFNDVLVTGRLLGVTGDADTAGHCDYGVNFLSSSAKWYDCGFQYGKIAAYRGWYHQYGEFHSCVFASAVFSPHSAGGLFDGKASLEASNENRFYSPRLFSNNNGLIIRGGIKNRIYSPTIQDTRAAGTAGIWLTTDGTGMGADGTTIHGAYCEINNVPAILVGIAPNTDISSAHLLGSSIYSSHIYNLALANINSYGQASIVLAHPYANADHPSVTIIGGNIVPDMTGLPPHTVIDQSQSGVRRMRNDNMLGTTGQIGPSALPLTLLSQAGFKSGVMRSIITDLFAINQETFSIPQYRFMVFELSLFCVADPAAKNGFGYSSHVQKNYVFITNNSTGAPQVSISAPIDAVDLGVAPRVTAPGVISLTSKVFGDQIRIQAAFAGAGSMPASTAQIQIGYKIEGTSGNPISITRL